MLAISTLRLCALTAAFSGSATPALADVVWSGDRAHSNVTLSVSQMLVAKIKGTIPIASATVVTADGSTLPLKVDALLDSAAMTTHDPRRDADLRSDKFFDVARFPTITFASERIVATGPDRFAIEGELTMRGVTRALALDGELTGVFADMHGRRHARYVARGRFRRSDYGMVYARGIVGNDVALDIVIEAVN
ncbi:MAG: YceI family protein [Candidatus Eremiobacteraeota bacterium]|nr:YceI family protein [Candidatus Eremiobacteraeota bacterium]MBV9409279.1 YceI family protein [Candidatus Eremiobacteraeota bacterium]